MGKTRPDEETSVFEDLDEPASPVDQRKLQWREVLLGLCLLVIVAVLGAGYWRQEEVQAEDYRAGDQAALAHHWDEARAHFVAAGDYPNAKARVALVATQIAERDKQYKLVLTALAKYDGVAALQALDALDKIETGYGGADLLRSEAHLQIYRSALEGVVAQRHTANPPGLYYRTATDWAWLQSSDTASTLHNYSSGDYIIYDVPAAGTSARRLMAAHLSEGSLVFTPLALDPATSVVWGAQGGWSAGYGCSGSVPPQLRSYYCADGLVYNAATSPITTPVRLPDPQWVVLDLARDGSRMLVAGFGAADEAAPQVSLYLTAPDGSDPHLLYQEASGLERAAFSPDGRYVIAALGTADAGAGAQYKAVLLDVSGQAAPYVLSTVQSADSALPADIDFVLLPGTGAGKVALAQSGGGLMMLTLVDLDTAAQGAPLHWISRPIQGPLLVTRLAEGGVLVCGQLARASIILDRLSTDSGACVQLDNAGQETTFDLPPIARYAIGYAWPRQGALIYPITVPGSGATALSVLRIAPDRTGAITPLPTVILQLSLGMGEALNVVAGQGLLAYARQGQLHVRSYDAGFDLLLEQGVDTLYDVGGATMIATLF